MDRKWFLEAVLFIFLIVVSIVLWGCASETEGPTTIPDTRLATPDATLTTNIKQLITRLGADDWGTREKAQAELIDIGKKLIQEYRKTLVTTEVQSAQSKDKIISFADALRSGVQSKDPEVKNRINRIRQDFYDWTKLKIVFVSERDGNGNIYIMDIDGKNQRRLTQNGGRNVNPSWSPDGMRILYYSYPKINGHREFWVMDADGQNQKRLTQNNADDFIDGWSPDGNKIVFNSERDGNDEIYIMDADGENQRNLTQNNADDFMPSWNRAALPEISALFEEEKK